MVAWVVDEHIEAFQVWSAICMDDTYAYTDR